MENLDGQPEKFKVNEMISETAEKDQINKFIELHGEGKLTKKMVNEWLNSLSEDERVREKGELETGLSEEIENLPE